jgi:hypothetical protein
MFIVIAAVAVSGHPGRVLAQSGVCGPETLRGLYIFSGSGYNIVGGVPQPTTLVEFLDFEGDGTMSVPTGTVSFNGNVNQAVVFRGVYTFERALQGSGQLGTGCRGTLTLLPSVGFDLYTDRTGTQVWLIRTAPGSAFQGTVTKLSN